MFRVWTLSRRAFRLCVMVALLGAAVPRVADAQPSAPAPATGSSRSLTPEEFQAFVTQLSSASVDERIAALDAIGARGFRHRRDATPHLRRLLREDPEWRARASAGRAIGRLSIRDGVPDLARALRDPQVDVRVVAAAALWRLPDPAAVPALVELLSDSDATARQWGALALGVTRDSRATQPLIGLLRDSAEDVRLDSVRSLGRIGDPVALAPLIAVVNDENHTQAERLEAINAIASLEGPDKVNALVRMLELRSTELRLQVIGALAQVGDALVIPALRRLASGPGSAAVAPAVNNAIRQIEERGREQAPAPGPAAAPSQGQAPLRDASAPG
jgi:HEAT repeat protein